MHISFDFDYTLADSSGGTIECANYALRQLGMEAADEAEIRKTIGLSLERTFERLGGGAADSSAAETFKRLFIDHAERVMLGHIRLYPGTARVLNALRADGHYISIVSTKTRERIEDAIARDGLSDLIDLVVGGSCVRNNKPHPDALLRAMDVSGVAIDQTLFIGDSVSDAECASRAGVRFIGLLSGETATAALSKWNPVSILDGIDDVPAYLSSLDGE